MLAKITPEGAVARYPYDLADLMADHPATSFPPLDLLSDADLADFGVVRVHPSDPPEHDPDTQYAVELPPEVVGGVWRQVWAIEERPVPTQHQRDLERYAKRAAAKDQLLAWMAADNMSRVRDGTWTVADLTGLLEDPAVVAANAYMQTLSYELAAQAIMSATTPLLTPEIKADWIGKLTEHFYLEV